MTEDGSLVLGDRRMNVLDGKDVHLRNMCELKKEKRTVTSKSLLEYGSPVGVS